MFSSILTFLRLSLYPAKQVLRLRLAPLHAYMGATFVFTVVVTLMDFLFLRPDFFIPMWLFLHGFAVFFFYLIWVACIALLVQLITRIRMKRVWPYRQAWPYAVAMTLVPTFLMVLLFQWSPAYSWVPVPVLLYYVGYPLTQIPLKKSRGSRI